MKQLIEQMIKEMGLWSITRLLHFYCIVNDCQAKNQALVKNIIFTHNLKMMTALISSLFVLLLIRSQGRWGLGWLNVLSAFTIKSEEQHLSCCFQWMMMFTMFWLTQFFCSAHCTFFNSPYYFLCMSHVSTTLGSVLIIADDTNLCYILRSAPSLNFILGGKKFGGSGGGGD